VTARGIGAYVVHSTMVGGPTVTLRPDDTTQLSCDCDALLRVTAKHAEPLHRPGCRATACRVCGQDRVSHTYDRQGFMQCPDGRGAE
jgi:hypothetical protein